MNQAEPSQQQENRPPLADLSQKLNATKIREAQDGIAVQDTEQTKTAEVAKPKHRRVSGLRLKANPKPSAEDGGRRFSLRVTPPGGNDKRNVPNFVSKERPKLFASDRIFEWRSFKLERTPQAMLDLQADAVPYTDLSTFITNIYEAIAHGPDGPMCEDRYLIWSNVTRQTMHGLIDPARKDGTIPKSARFTHFVPSNILIVKIPVDCSSSAGYLDFVTKPIIAWSYSLGLGRDLKLCSNTRYLARIPDSCVEGLDFDAPHPALEHIAAANPGIVDGFGSFNECDAGFRPFRARSLKFDTPSVVVESSFGSDFSILRYKACWWLQLMAGQVMAVVLVNVDPSEQEIVLEVWRNEEPDELVGERRDPTPARVQKVVVAKRDEFKGRREEANADHYRVEGGALVVRFEDFWLEPVVWEWQTDMRIDEDTLAQEAADLWFADGILVNDWVDADSWVGQ